MKTAAILYVPVWHRGYQEFFERHRVDCAFILDADIVKEFQPTPERRALGPLEAARIIKAVTDCKAVVIINRISKNASLARLTHRKIKLVTLNDDVCRGFIEKNLKRRPVVFDSAFVRWDRNSVFSQNNIVSDRISKSAFDRKMMRLARRIGDQTSDWWRQIGAVLVKRNRAVLTAYNRHLPTPQAPYFNGDPRDVLPAGQHSEFSSALHAEQNIVAQAAKIGLSLEGASIYVTAFPCPVCAKLIAASGISKCFFEIGSGSLDGQNVLKAASVEIIHVARK